MVTNMKQYVYSLKGRAFLILSLLLLTVGIVRGGDYGGGDSLSTARRLTALENAASLWIWGLLFTLAGCVGFISIAFEYLDGVIAAHAVYGALYATISAGLILDVLSRMDESGGHFTWVHLLPIITIFIVAITIFKKNQKSAWLTLSAIIIATVLSLVTVELDGLRNATAMVGLALVHIIISVSVSQNKIQFELIQERDGAAYADRQAD